MFKLLPLIFILFLSLTTGAAPSCQAIFERKTTQDFLAQINEKYGHIFYQKSIDENIQKSFYLSKKIKLYKLARMLKKLEKRSDSYDAHDISQFVFKLDRLAFADTILNNPELSAQVSKRDQLILSEARRSVLTDGIVKYFEIDQSHTTFWKKMLFYLSESTSWKYWRWTQAMIYMPKLMGVSLPKDLAEKLLIDGLDEHRAELERYVPAVKSRAYFNSFSKLYNSAVVAALLTVVPYMTHSYYVEQMKIGEANAAQILQPLVKTTEDMAQINYLDMKESGAVEKYIEAYTVKYGTAPSLEQVSQAKKVIHQRLISEAGSSES